MEDLAGYLASKGLQVFRAAGAEVTVHCIFCSDGDSRGKGKLYLNSESWLYECKRCSTRGNRVTLLRHFGDTDELSYLPGQDPLARRKVLEESVVLGVQMLHNNDEMCDYLISRGLKAHTIRDYRLGYVPASWSLCSSLSDTFTVADKISAGVMSADGHDFFRDRILLPYLTHGSVVQLRGKDPQGKYFTPAGEGVRLFNADRLQGAEDVIITEGEFDCFSTDTEVLTANGWVSFERYLPGTAVVQYEEGGRLSLVEPLAYTRKTVERTLSLRTVKRGGLDLRVTPGHRVVSTLPDGSGLRVDEAEHRPPAHYHVPRVGFLDGPGIPHSDDEIALLLAIAADATVDHRVLDGAKYVRFGFTKERKIVRLEAVLKRLGVEYSSHALDSGHQSICFRVPNYLDAFKRLPTSWLILASSIQREFILAEMVEWDGNHVISRSQVEFSSRSEEDVAWMQAMAHTSGRVSTIQQRSNAHGSWFKASVLHDKRSTSWQSIKTTEAGPAEVACVQVPSGMLLVRRNREIAVSGNCLVLQQALELSADPRIRATAVVGIPGAGSLPLNFDSYFSQARRVYVGLDPDDAGKKGAIRIKELLGSKARIVELPEDLPKCDWTEYIRRGATLGDITELLGTAAGRRLWSIGDAAAKWRRRQVEAPGIKTGFTELDSWYAPGFEPGDLIVPLAKTGQGKTQWLCSLAYNTRDVPSLFVTMEMTASQIYDRLRKIHLFFHPHADDADIEEGLSRLRIVDENRLAEGDISALCDEYAEEMGERPQQVFVDYLGYYAKGCRGVGAYEKTTAAVMGLKAEAKSGSVAVIAPHQVNRGAEMGKPLSASDARDSGAVEETADLLLSLFRPDAAIEGAEQVPSGLVRMQVLKNRKGAVGMACSLMFSSASLVLVDAGTPWARVAEEENRMVWRGLSYEQIREYRKNLPGASGQLRLA